MMDGLETKQYEDEAKRRWGNTDAYKESQKRTAKYTQEDWNRQGQEAAVVNAELAACMERGVAADSAEAMALAERHRLHIDTWFYPCSHEHQIGLAGMYLNDERFARNYEKVKRGLTQYLRDAIVANAKRNAK